jgi:hypothetical protein
VGSTPPPIVGHSAEIFGDEMIIFGGEDASGNTNHVYKLDLSKLEWSKVQRKETGLAPPTERSYHSSCLIPSSKSNNGQP